MFMFLLKETVFTNTEVQKIIVNIDGNELEHIGEYDYTGGIRNNAMAIDGNKEKDIVLGVGKYLQSDLQNKGVTVIMTLDTNTNFSTYITADLVARVNIANNANADLFISLHCNGETASANGTEAFWPGYHDDSPSKSLANEWSVGS